MIQHDTRVKLTLVTMFTRHLVHLLNAGISLAQALALLVNKQMNKNFRIMLQEIYKKVQQGMAFSQALALYPKTFNTLFCSLITIGEKTGELEQVLKLLVDYQEQKLRIKAKLQQALIYPCFILIMAVAVGYLMLVYVLPQFVTLLNHYAAQLPKLTQIVMTIATFVVNHIILIVGSGFALGSLVFIAKKRSRVFNDFCARSVLQLPFLGKVLRILLMGRIMRTLAISLKVGVPIVTSFHLVASVTGNPLYDTALHKVAQQMSEGEPLSEVMKKTSLFPEDVLQMFAVGEASGNLEKMLDKIATLFEDELEQAIHLFNILLEPMIMLVLGLLLAIFILAMYLPIFKLGHFV